MVIDEFVRSCNDIQSVIVCCWQAVEFADDRSQCLYNDAFELFKTSNAGRDQHVDFTVEYDLPSYAKELAIRDPSRQWLSSKHFVLASLFCFTWPYRWILNSSKNEYHYRIVKKVTVSPTDFQLPVPIGHPADIDIANGEEHPLLAVVPSIPVPLTPPPPYEEWFESFFSWPNTKVLGRPARSDATPIFPYLELIYCILEIGCGRRSIKLATFYGCGLVTCENRLIKLLNHDTRPILSFATLYDIS